MSEALTDKIIAFSYQGLIKTSNNNDIAGGNLTSLTDGFGNILSLEVGTRSCLDGVRVCGDVKACGNLSVNDNASIGNTLTVSSSACIFGKTRINGQLTASGLNYPTSDGTVGQMLYTDGNNNIVFDDPPDVSGFGLNLIPIGFVAPFYINSLTLANTSIIDSAYSDVTPANVVTKLNSGDVLYLKKTSGAQSDGPLWQFANGSNMLNNAANGTVPDLRARFVIGTGQRTGSQAYDQNNTGGIENPNITLGKSNMPAHNHSVSVYNVFKGNWITVESTAPSSGLQGVLSTPMNVENRTGLDHSGRWNANTAGGTTNSVGNGTPFDVSPPYMSLFYIIRVK